VRVGSSPVNDEADQDCQMVRARQARRKAYVRSQRLNASQESHQLESGGSGLGCSAHPHEVCGELLGWVMSPVGRPR
jgi:hypothetical protein